ncbi:MAG: protein kinase [Candidatus Korarchaeum sp.]
MIDLRDLRTRRDVDQDAFYRMKREAEIIKKVQKIREYGIEHIIKLYEDGTEAQYELPYLVVEYCERGSLLGVCGKMSEREILIVLYQIAYTLKRCYEEGIFQKHGDIKPENILIDSQGRPVISDFHTARRRGRVSSFEESRTLGYFIDFPDDRADVYALGRLAIDLAKGIEGKRSDLTTSPLYYLIQRAYPGEERLSGGIPNIDEFLDEIEKIFNIYYC